MKRISVHAAFALAALGAAAFCGTEMLRLHRAHALNAAIAAATSAPVDANAAAASTDLPPEVRLARATALSRAGVFDAAFKSYSGLIDTGAPDAVGRHALYNLGNMYLREGLAAVRKSGGAASAEAGPLVELAKQRYRDLLRVEPGDWDARYNLERALRLAPEEEAAAAEEIHSNVEQRSVKLPGMEPGDLP